MSNTITIKKSLAKKDAINDSSSASVLIDNISEECSKISNSFNEIASILNKAVYKKIIDGEDTDKFINLSRKCSSLADRISNKSNTLGLKYEDDEKSILINQLNERIEELEKKINYLIDEED